MARAAISKIILQVRASMEAPVQVNETAGLQPITMRHAYAPMSREYRRVIVI